MSRFHQSIKDELSDSEFVEAFYKMRADIALLQELKEARKALKETSCNEREGPTDGTAPRTLD